MIGYLQPPLGKRGSKQGSKNRRIQGLICHFNYHSSMVIVSATQYSINLLNRRRWWTHWRSNRQEFPKSTSAQSTWNNQSRNRIPLLKNHQSRAPISSYFVCWINLFENNKPVERSECEVEKPRLLEARGRIVKRRTQGRMRILHKVISRYLYGTNCLVKIDVGWMSV